MVMFWRLYILKENIEYIARRWFEEMWSIPELDIADEIVDESYKPEWIPIDESGPAQIKYEIKAFRSVFPDLKYQINDIISGDGKVWVRYKGRGTQKGKGSHHHSARRNNYWFGKRVL